jgi:glycerol-3-phosphate O-acyltransferase
VFPIEVFTAAVGALQQILLELEAKGKMELSEQIRYSTADLVRDGIKNLGVYHVRKPLMFNKNGHIESDDFKTLYYYHNHLENYGLAKRVNWDLFKIEEVKTVS